MCGYLHGCQSDLSLTWFGRARTAAGREEGRWQSSKTLRFAPSSDVCTWYGIKLAFPNYQMHQHCREGRKNKGKYHRDWRERGRECYARLLIKKQNFTGTQYKTTSILSYCLSSSSTISFLFQVRHYCVNTCRGREETSPNAPVWNILSVHKICLRIWELCWLHNSTFQINNLSPANTFLCSYTFICFWKAAGTTGRQKRLVLAGELSGEPPVAWVLLATGGRVLFSQPPAPTS